MRDSYHLTLARGGNGAPALMRLAPLLALLALTLFPFGWLGTLWPAFGHGIDAIFSTDMHHAIGHASLFCLLGLVALAVLPHLRDRPWRYLAIMLLAGVGQEFFQMLYKRRLLIFDNSRDLLTDLAGVLLAFVIVWSWGKRTHSEEQNG
ncbi:MAG TPA: hypothetical protein VFU22_15660 [Roseiflexaceae bacterium]|nr:hypothetical protein [Roseiflexaceae bacterium]